jgi:hypothetical protein
MRQGLTDATVVPAIEDSQEFERFAAGWSAIRGPRRYDRNTKHGSTLQAAPSGATNSLIAL